MKKVLIYTENYERGGGNQYLVDLINNIPNNFSVFILSNKEGLFKEDLDKIRIKFNHSEIDILSIVNLYKKISRITENKTVLFSVKLFVKIFRYVLLFFFKRANFSKIKDFITDKEFDLIISCNGGYPGGLSCLDCINVAKSRHIKTWLSVVSMPQSKSGIDFLYSGIFNKIDKLIVNSNEIKYEFLRTRLIKKDKIEVLYNCLPNNSIDLSPKKQIIYGAGLEEYILGYVGRIEKAKGVFYLLDAFAELVGDFPNLKLVLVGSGADLDLAKIYCIEKEISEKVEFTGFYFGDINIMLRTFNLFVFPSLWEGLPYSILEAMANSKLVVSTNVGGIPEIIEDNINGFLVPPGNSKALFEKIKSVLNDLKDYDAIQENSLNTIKSKFSENNFSQELNSFFMELEIIKV